MFEKSDDKKPEILINQSIDYASVLSNPDNNVWELIFDSLPDMVALIDVNNIIVKANKLMRQKLKVGESSLTGHSCYDILHDKGCAVSNCPHLSMIKDLKMHSIELFESKLGCYLNITTTPVFDSHGKILGSLHIARDISVQKESEAKLQEYNSELKDLNQSKDKFFSIVAHDLRSPFQGMIGFTDLILDELETLSKAEIKEYLQKVRDSTYSTFTLLENLLNWSRLQTGRLQYTPTQFNLNGDIEKIINLLISNAQSKNIHIVNNVDTDYIVFADQQMMHSVLLNLTTNAIKFTHPGGTVTFDAKIVTRCEIAIDGKSTCQHKCLELSVTDTGVGIPEESLVKLFNLNEHVSISGTSNEPGAGLGLKLVKEMTEKHGGELKVESQVGKGSVFSFKIPLDTN